jgi:hypothetical protein
MQGEKTEINKITNYTDKKENLISLIYKEIQSAWSSCKVIYEEGLPYI